MTVDYLCSNYQPGDGCGPSVQQQLDLNPFAEVIKSGALIYGMVCDNLISLDR